MFNSQLNAADEKGKEMFSSILLFVKQITSLLAEDGIGVTAFPTCNLYSARIFKFNSIDFRIFQRHNYENRL